MKITIRVQVEDDPDEEVFVFDIEEGRIRHTSDFDKYDFETFYREEWHLPSRLINTLRRREFAPWELLDLNKRVLLRIQDIGPRGVEAILAARENVTKEEVMQALKVYRKWSDREIFGNLRQA